MPRLLEERTEKVAAENRMLREMIKTLSVHCRLIEEMFDQKAWEMAMTKAA